MLLLNCIRHSLEEQIAPLDYQATFSVTLILRSRDDSALGLADAFSYEILERNLIGEPKGKLGKHAWTENRLTLAVRPGMTGYVESVVTEVADHVSALSAPIREVFKKGRPWLIVHMLDSEFVELHFDHEMMANLANIGLSVSIENRA